MKKLPLSILALFLGLLFFPIASVRADDDETARNPPVVLAHYMPWYASKPVGGAWGWHWTMDHFDPDIFRWDGRREVASRDYPLIGLYDSSDPDVLECHALLMKFSGIDGVVIDWYGTEDFNDYAAVHRNTEALIAVLKKAGLKFAICYEDQSVKHMVAGGKLAEDAAIDHAKKVLGWVEENWFADEAYVRHEGRPILPVFGPQHFLSADQWESLTADLSTNPLVLGLPHLADKAGIDGVFGWPPVTGGKTIGVEAWNEDLEKLYGRASGETTVMGVAYPGFEDIYAQAGLHESYGRIDPREGRTLAETLDRALASGAPLVQVATFNDFGEGTVVEPTWKWGYRHLEEIQRRIGEEHEPSDLRLPILLYQLRKRGADKATLDEAASRLFAGETGEAAKRLDQAKAELETGHPAVFFDGAPRSRSGNYRLHTDIAYRAGEEGATGYMKTRCRLDVYAPADLDGFATVLWFHGGGISHGHRSVPIPLLNRGVAVVAANYRLSPQVKTPAFLEDAAAAVAWVFENIEDYGGDPDRVFVSGHSAGGYLASMVGMDKSYLEAFDLDADRIAGLVPFSGHSVTHFTIRKEQGIPGTQATVDRFAPLFHVRKDAPPTLLITGDREREIFGRYEETAYFWRMMRVVGHPDCTLRELDGFDHGGMPEPAFPLLLDFMSRKAAP